VRAGATRARTIRRGLQTAVGVGLVGLGLALWILPGKTPPQGNEGFRLLPDPGGPITLAVCSVCSARRAALRNAALVSHIVNVLPPRVRMLLLVNDRAAFTIASNPWPKRVAFVELPAETDITIWPQDPFVVLRDAEGRTRLLVSRRFERAGDRRMAYAIAEQLGWDCRDSSLCFEGGNIVSDDEYVFIGANTVRYNAVLLNEPETSIVRRFEAELGRRVLVVGPMPQPVGHIDMILTPLGRRRLVLADPGWGAELAEQALRDVPEKVTAFERRCEQMYFGHPAIRELRDQAGHVLRPPPVIGGAFKAVEDSRAIAPELDRLAERLGERGYRVFRMPMLYARPRNEPTSQPTPHPRRVETRPADAGLEWKLGYPQLTYNNVLLEHTDGQWVVYLPQYGWAELDQAARRAWQELGYEVRPVRGLTTSAMYGGSLRCCVKILSRSEARIAGNR